MPQPFTWHQRAGNRIAHRTDDQLPRHLVALSEVEVVVVDQPLTIRVPDAIVTRRVDRVMKFAEYAEAGIPQYWIVDLGSPTTLLAYTLANGHDELSGEHSGTVALDVAGHPVTLDLDALTTR